MKICPQCQKTYPDDTGFCLLDGTPLTSPLTDSDVHLAAGLAGHFRILRRLGKGGMGTVYLAEQIAVGSRRVALKTLNLKYLDEPDFLERFHDEAGSTGRIHHPNVVTVYESGQASDGTPYIAMEFLEGEPLRDAVEKRGALPLAEVNEILQQAARGLNAAHRLGIIHRDLKPDNIFLTRGDGDELVVKVVDFGIAKLRESTTHTLTGTVLGTPAYMSPEQAYGMRSDELDARSDVYSLGVVVYEMLAGSLPFHSDTPSGFLRMHLLEAPPPFRSVAPGLPVPAPVEAVVMKALVKKRDQRYASTLEFAHAFAGAVTSTPLVQASEPLASTRIAIPAATPEGRSAEWPAKAPSPRGGSSQESLPPRHSLRFWDKVTTGVRSLIGRLPPRPSLLSGGVLVLVSLFLPVTYESCGGPKTGLEFVRGANAELPGILLSGNWGRGTYVFTLVLALVTILLVALSVAAPSVFRGRGLTRVLFGAAGLVSLQLLAGAVKDGLFVVVLFSPGHSMELFFGAVAGLGIVSFGLALRSKILRSSKLMTVFLVLGCVDCLILLSSFIVTLLHGTGFLSDKIRGWVLIVPLLLYWLLPAYLWFRYRLMGKPEMQESWVKLRDGIAKLYLPCTLAIPIVFWGSAKLVKAWGCIPYTVGFHLLAMGYMQLDRSNREHAARDTAEPTPPRTE